MRIYPAKPEKVYFYSTCLVDLFDPEAGLSAMALLKQQGIDVIYIEKQTCCGQPAYTSGYDDEARDIAQHQMALFPQPYPVIVLSGSCGGMMHQHYQRLFKDHPLESEVKAFCDRVFELTEFLVNVCHARFKDNGKPTSVVMHTSCSARREMNVHISATQLISQLDNVELKIQDYESDCCGFGGTFAVRHPQISQAMVEDKVAHLLSTGAEYLVSADWGCLLNINGSLQYQEQPLQGRHLATFLLERTQGAL
ncbi:Lactate utilization protein A [Vibrio aerogenes CECT 7868]|uniref:Lactate utilization protein A n=1 Tax=Vibrio aerogenes CECT 7868 TaxID=1216006 RepID=A0A1M5YHP6_9VIBR|nr:(Fe-S)-binding protein [Vibrio aerogenes]SHI11492.1 Lactate utilization protein A [Vibrio aerogenes CECT 7868]